MVHPVGRVGQDDDPTVGHDAAQAVHEVARSQRVVLGTPQHQGGRRDRALGWRRAERLSVVVHGTGQRPWAAAWVTVGWKNTARQRPKLDDGPQKTDSHRAMDD